MRSAHLALSTKRFTDQFDFAVSDRNSYVKEHTALSGTARLALAYRLGFDVMTCAEMSPSRLTYDALCIYAYIMW